MTTGKQRHALRRARGPRQPTQPLANGSITSTTATAAGDTVQEKDRRTAVKQSAVSSGASSRHGSSARTVNGMADKSHAVKEQSVPNGNAGASSASADAQNPDKRSLRSQDGGSRSRSELFLYFPNYEELISNEPKQTGP